MSEDPKDADKKKGWNDLGDIAQPRSKVNWSEGIEDVPDADSDFGVVSASADAGVAQEPPVDGAWAVVRPRRAIDNVAVSNTPIDTSEEEYTSFTDDQLNAVRDYLAKHVSIDVLPATSRVPNRITIIVDALRAFIGANDQLNLPNSRSVALALMKRLTGMGVLQQFLDDAKVTEIIVQSYDHIKIERGGRLTRQRVRFENEESLRDTVQQFTALASQKLDTDTPTVDFSLPDGTRVNVVIPPATPGQTYLTIRRAKTEAFPMQFYVDTGAMSAEMAEFLTWCRRAHLTIAAAGGTGTGKSTLIETLIGIVPNEEVVMCEEVPELKPMHPNLRSLVVPTSNRKSGGVDLNHLVRTALRMRPDVIVVGECRGPEAEALLWALTTGHRGGMTTLHAETAEQVCQRVATFATMGDNSAYARLPSDLLMSVIASSFDIIVILRRHPTTGQRVIWSIDELSGYEKGHFVISNVFSATWGVDENNQPCAHWTRNVNYRASTKVYDQLNEAEMIAHQAGDTHRPTELELGLKRRAIIELASRSRWPKVHELARQYIEHVDDDALVNKIFALSQGVDDGSQLSLPAGSEIETAQRQDAVETIESARDTFIKSLLKEREEADATRIIIEHRTEATRAAQDVASTPGVARGGERTFFVKQAAEYLGLSASSIRKIDALGTLRALRNENGDRVYTLGQLEAYAKLYRKGPYKDLADDALLSSSSPETVVEVPQNDTANVPVVEEARVQGEATRTALPETDNLGLWDSLAPVEAAALVEPENNWTLEAWAKEYGQPNAAQGEDDVSSDEGAPATLAVPTVDEIATLSNADQTEAGATPVVSTEEEETTLSNEDRTETSVAPWELSNEEDATLSNEDQNEASVAPWVISTEEDTTLSGEEQTEDSTAPWEISTDEDTSLDQLLNEVAAARQDAPVTVIKPLVTAEDDLELDELPASQPEEAEVDLNMRDGSLEDRPAGTEELLPADVDAPVTTETESVYVTPGWAAISKEESLTAQDTTAAIAEDFEFTADVPPATLEVETLSAPEVVDGTENDLLLVPEAVGEETGRRRVSDYAATPEDKTDVPEESVSPPQGAMLDDDLGWLQDIANTSSKAQRLTLQEESDHAEMWSPRTTKPSEDMLLEEAAKPVEASRSKLTDSALTDVETLGVLPAYTTTQPAQVDDASEEALEMRQGQGNLEAFEEAVLGDTVNGQALETLAEPEQGQQLNTYTSPEVLDESVQDSTNENFDYTAPVDVGGTPAGVEVLDTAQAWSNEEYTVPEVLDDSVQGSTNASFEYIVPVDDTPTKVEVLDTAQAWSNEEYTVPEVLDDSVQDSANASFEYVVPVDDTPTKVEVLDTTQTWPDDEHTTTQPLYEQEEQTESQIQPIQAEEHDAHPSLIDEPAPQSSTEESSNARSEQDAFWSPPAEVIVERRRRTRLSDERWRQVSARLLGSDTAEEQRAVETEEARPFTAEADNLELAEANIEARTQQEEDVPAGEDVSERDELLHKIFESKETPRKGRRWQRHLRRLQGDK